MKIYLPNDSRQSIGGGWTFRRNFEKGLKPFPGYTITDQLEDADIHLIAGPTMITRDTFNKLCQSKGKVVTRLDSVPRNSRNRNTGTSRLFDFATNADMIVWQSQWARDHLDNFIKKPGKVIYNGVDYEIFNPSGDKLYFEGGPVYIYSRYSRDENKRWEEAWYEYQEIHKKNPESKLLIVGRFSSEQLEYDFDFFRDENFQYLGVVEDPRFMARVLRGCDYMFMPYFNDCYSNTYLEALACGVKPYKTISTMSGGTPELLKVGPRSLSDMVKDYINLFEEVLKNEQ